MTEGGEWLEQRQKDLGTDNKPFRRKMRPGERNIEWEMRREMLSGIEKSISTMWCKKTDNNSRRAGGHAQRDTQSIVIMVMSSSLHPFFLPPLSLSPWIQVCLLCIQEESRLPSSDSPPPLAPIRVSAHLSCTWIWPTGMTQSLSSFTRTAVRRPVPDCRLAGRTRWLSQWGGGNNFVVISVAHEKKREGEGERETEKKETRKEAAWWHVRAYLIIQSRKQGFKKNTFCSLSSASILCF